MKNWMFRGAGLIAMSTSLLACVGMEDDMVADTDDLAAEADAVAAETDELLADDSVSEKAVTPKLVPLVVELYQDFNYTGDVRYVYRQEGYLGNSVGCSPGLGFADTVSSVKVRKGPDFEEWQERWGTPYVYLFQDDLYRGRRLALTIGGYPDLRDLDFENKASSVEIPSLSLPPADLREPSINVAPHGPVSVIIEAHTEPQHLRCSRPNQKMTILRSQSDISRDFGAAFQDKISSIDIIRGTSFDATNKLTLYVNANYSGYKYGVYHDSASLPDLRDLDIDNAISSIILEQ